MSESKEAPPDATVQRLAREILAALAADPDQLRIVARAFMGELAADPQFRTLLREVVLLTYSVNDEHSREGYVRSLVRACKERGAKLHVSACGGLVITNGKRMGWDLREAVEVYRTDILEQLSTRNGAAKRSKK